jgi:plastocyanin
MRRVFLVLTLVVLAVAALPACSGAAAAPTCDTPTAATQVELSDFAFGPECVEASAGDTLTITNTGGAPHTFTVSDTDVNVSLDDGETGEAVLDGLTAGTTYAVHCTYHPQMVGALKIV